MSNDREPTGIYGGPKDPEDALFDSNPYGLLPADLDMNDEDTDLDDDDDFNLKFNVGIDIDTDDTPLPANVTRLYTQHEVDEIIVDLKLEGEKLFEEGRRFGLVQGESKGYDNGTKAMSDTHARKLAQVTKELSDSFAQKLDEASTQSYNDGYALAASLYRGIILGTLVAVVVAAALVANYIL